MLAAGDRHDAHLLQLHVAFDVVGDHRLFQPARFEFGQLGQHAAGVLQGPAHVALEHDVHVGPGQLTQRADLFDVLAHARRAVLRAVAEAHLQRGEALVQVTLGLFQEQVEVVVGVELGRVGPDLLLGAPAQQLEYRLVHRLAHDVPDGQVHRRDGGHADALAAPGMGAAVHLLPDVFVVEGVFADGDGGQVEVDDLLGHARRQGAVANTDNAGVGLHLHHQPAVEAE
ncbi:hypothetical protein D3C80_736880 [compost metagenome]